MSSHPWSTDIDKFLAMCLASGLLSTEALRTAWDRYQTARTSSDDGDSLTAFCRLLVEQELLTEWQCEKLRNGRYKGFFLDHYKLLSVIGNDDSHMICLAADTRNKRHVKLLISPGENGGVDYQMLELEAE